jgi:predicted nucleotidyltransferase
LPPESLRTLARHLDVPERTLRRAAGEGLIHGRRISPRRWQTSLREEAYLRRHWPLLRELRNALRTEPNARLAVLFGSQATGLGTPRSDVDLLVALRDDSPVRVAELAGRLERRLGQTVQIICVKEAEQNPMLMVDALEQGRVLVDRDRDWPRLTARASRWRSAAAASEKPLEESLPDLGV